MNKINFYIFNEIFRGFLLILFIFLSIAWLLQFTRLMSISNLLQIDTLSILALSVYLVPNLFTTILTIYNNYRYFNNIYKVIQR